MNERVDVIKGVTIEPDNLNISSLPNYHGKLLLIFQRTALIICVILFVLPTIIEFLFKILDIYGDAAHCKIN